MARSNESIPITAAPIPMREDQRQRARRYLISMALRTVCFVGAIFAQGWLRWALVLGAVFLPYVAVVMANAGRSRTSDKQPQLIIHDQRRIESGREP